MRTRHKLNVKQAEALKEPGIYSDGGCLYLRVRPTGSKYWLFIYSVDKKRHELGLGNCFDITLAKAREKAAALRLMILDGQDPLKARAAIKVAAEPVTTFGKFAMGWLDDVEDGFRNPKHRQQWRNTLKTYAEPLFELPITDVTTEHVLEILKPIWLTKAETAGRVRGRIERVIDAAKVKGLYPAENPARGRGHLDLMLPMRSKAEVKHHAALPFGDMRAFMTDLAVMPGIAAKALQFTILTAARSGETRGMTWGEVDMTGGVWTIPADRMKAKATHQVPLSKAALAVLLEVKPADPPSDGLVFPAPRGGVLSDMTMSAVLKRMKRKVTVHGFRSTFRDWAGDTTQHERETIEMALAHTIMSATERAYRRGRALDKRRDLMVDWATHCTG